MTKQGESMEIEMPPDFNLDKRKLAVSLALLGLWAALQFFLGNQVYALFVIVFFLIVLRVRPPSFGLLAASVLILVLFYTPVLDTLTRMRQTNLYVVQNLSLVLSQILRPSAGLEVLPAPAQQALSLLQENEVESYQLSEQLFQDDLVKQRIIESAWPVAMDPAAPLRLSYLAELQFAPGCVLIDQREEVALVACR